MNSHQVLELILCKLTSNDRDTFEENAKLFVEVKKGKEIKVSTPAIFRNNCANFYRQVFQFSTSNLDILITIMSLEPFKVLAQVTIQKSVLQDLNDRKTAFSTSSQLFSLLWEAQIAGAGSNDNQETDRDFFQGNEGNQVSDSFQPGDKIREKRRKFSLMKMNTACYSEPPEMKEQEIGLTMDSLQLLRQISECVDQSSQFGYPFTDRIIPKEVKKKPEQNEQQKEKVALKSKMGSQPKKVRPSMSPAKGSRLKKCRSGLLDKISIQSVLSAAAIGIISGIASAYI